MKNITIVFLLFVFCLPWPFSCDYRTSKYGPSTFQIDSLTVKVGQIEYRQYYYSFIEMDFDTLTSDTLISSKFGLQLNIEDVSYITQSTYSPIRFGLISSAMADPVPPRSKSKLSLISIYSEKAVLANGLSFGVGDNLAGLFKISSGYGEPQEILKYVEFNNEWYQWEPILLHFSAILDQPFSQTLQVKITMDDGTVFDLETSHVVVK